MDLHLSPWICAKMPVIGQSGQVVAQEPAGAGQTKMFLHEESRSGVYSSGRREAWILTLLKPPVEQRNLQASENTLRPYPGLEPDAAGFTAPVIDLYDSLDALVVFR